MARFLLAATFFHLSVPHLIDYDHEIDLPTTQPLIIAHRGSSGIYPEHTSASYQLAIDQGADIIECDVSVTKDLHLVCLHDSWMGDVTNVADIFPVERKNLYHVTDKDQWISDYFSVDYTIEEMESICMRQRFSYRDQSFNDQYQILTLHEFIDIAKTSERPVGIYVETKNPKWVNNLDIMIEANVTLEDLIVDAVTSHGYVSEFDPCFLQSFDFSSLLRMSKLTPLPLVVLLRSSGSKISNEDLEFYSTFAYGIAPNKNHIVQVGSDNRITEITDLVDRAQNFGLRVHPYTARNEHEHLPFDYEQDPYQEYMTLLLAGVDGIFSDFPGTYKRYLQDMYCEMCV